MQEESIWGDAIIRTDSLPQEMEEKLWSVSRYLINTPNIASNRTDFCKEALDPPRTSAVIQIKDKQKILISK